MADDHTFPQHGDEPDAANWAQLAGRSNATDYVETGLSITNVDWTVPDFDIGAGTAYIKADSMDTAHPDIDPGETRTDVGYVVEKDAEADVGLTDNAVNYVFLDANRGTDDAPQLFVKTDDAAPTDASIKIAEIDTSNNTFTEVNRDPDITAESLAHYPAEEVPQSVSANITNGFPVAHHPTAGVKSVDPRSFSTHDAALQALNDWLYEVGNDNVGAVHIPAKPAGDGTEWAIENTVTWGKEDDKLRVLVYGHGFNRATVNITTTINDGSPVFHFTGDTVNGANIRGCRLEGCTFSGEGLDNEIIKFTRANYWYLQASEINSIGGVGVVIDSACYDWLIDDTNFVGGNNGGIGVEFRDSLNWTGGGPGDGALGPGVSMMQGFDVCVYSSVPTSVFDIYGHYEGANGRAVLDFPSGKPNITPGVHINAGDSHAIYIDGKFATVEPAQIAGVNSDGVHVGPNAEDYDISSSITFEQITGDAIIVEAEPSDGQAYVPHPSQISESVSYPGESWNNLIYQSGWKRRQSGVTTVNAGSTTSIFKYAARPGEQFEFYTWVENDPGADIAWDVNREWNSTDGQVRLTVTETSGASAVDIGWEIVYRG